MKIAGWAIAIFFTVATGCIVWMTILTTTLIRQTYEDTNKKVDTIIHLVDKRIGDILIATNVTAQRTDERIASIQTDADEQLTLLREELLGQVKPLVGQVSGTVGQVNGLVGQVSALVPQISPVLQAATKTVGDTDLLVQEMKPEAVGLLRDSRLTSAEFARTSIYIRQNTPAILANFNQIELDVRKSTDSASQASAATAAMMINLKKATTPLPPWIRIPLSITGAVAPTVAGAVSAAAATGAFQK